MRWAAGEFILFIIFIPFILSKKAGVFCWRFHPARAWDWVAWN